MAGTEHGGCDTEPIRRRHRPAGQQRQSAADLDLERSEGLDRHVVASCGPVADPERRRRRHTEETGLVTGKIDQDRGVTGMGVAERERSSHD
jgi:hypothetical protein